MNDYTKITKEELVHIHRTTCSKLVELMEKKNHDYSGAGGALDNFFASRVLGIDPALGILLRCQDKFMRIKTFVAKGSLMVEGEGVVDAIEDVINYMVLIKAVIMQKEREEKSCR